MITACQKYTTEANCSTKCINKYCVVLKPTQGQISNANMAQQTSSVNVRRTNEWPVIEGHCKHEVYAGLQEAVGASKVPHFTFTAAQQSAYGTADGVRATVLVDADTQIHRVTLETLLAPACKQSQQTAKQNKLHGTAQVWLLKIKLTVIIQLLFSCTYL